MASFTVDTRRDRWSRADNRWLSNIETDDVVDVCTSSALLGHRP